MNKLNILWTTDNRDTFFKMISLYANYSFEQGWWDSVNIIIWGPSAKLVGEDKEVQDVISKSIKNGISFEACLVCTDSYEVTNTIQNLGVITKYMGEPLTQYLKNDEKVLTL